MTIKTTYTPPEECPHCGTAEPLVKSREVLNAYIPITFNGDEAEFGVWDTDPASMSTQDYIYDCCHEELEEHEQRAIDRMLGNERWDITWTPHTHEEATNG